ncbi:MAG: hypothetical protein PPHEINF_5383 [uncultured Paraburkholderia sp.]|nr:MAG: hypothetical protein PPHEINF_5383 [uncultured Paraburkholderia sp.]CAH2811209.1 MAG: hypothetical protein PPHEESC_6323 [uncultured Paraburkholderia sp.]CAH2946143.1 MAG: hypothetical protein PPHEMADMSA_6419 [uncultured Paraburkholderia sp.]
MPLSRLKPKSDSAVVRNMLTEIEAALDAGASRESVWKTLCEEQGLSIGFDGFCKALWRARKSKGERTKPAKPATPPPAALPSAPVTSISETPENDVDSATQKGAGNTEEPQQQPSSDEPTKNRIRTRKDFQKVHKMDFSDFDPKLK